MGKIKCEKPNALVRGGKTMMMQKSGFQNIDVQPYLQVGSMHPEKTEGNELVDAQTQNLLR